MAWFARVASGPEPLIRALGEHKLLEPGVLGYAVMDTEEDMKKFLLQILPGLDPIDLIHYEDKLKDLIQASRDWSKRRRATVTGESLPEAVAKGELRRRQAVAELREGQFRERAIAMSSLPVGKKALGPSGASWPAGTRRQAADCPSHSARGSAEESERRRWLEKAVEIIAEAGLPVARGSLGAAGTDLVLHAVGQGRRYRTIRKRVTDWARVRRFLQMQHGTVWPTNFAQFLGYLNAQVDGGATRSPVVGALAALTFLEKTGGVEMKDAIHAHPSTKAVFQELCVVASKGNTRAVKKAPQYLALVLEGLERVVVLSHHKMFVRMAAWWKLFQFWGCLRFDDHRGLVPSRMSLGTKGLQAVLTRTKTTGAGKSLEELRVVVSSDAYFSQKSWLQIGFQLWKETDPNRDFFLGIPTADLQGMRTIEAKYTDGLAIGRAVLLSIAVEGSREPLLVEDAARFWSEHSARSTLPSLATLCGSFPPEWLDLLGRWGARRSEVYVRTQLQRTVMIQNAVASRFRNNTFDPDLFGESDLLENLCRHLRSAGVSGDLIEAQVQRLSKFGRTVSAANLALADTSAELEPLDMAPAASGNKDSRLVEAEEVDVGLGIFVVSVRGQRRMLHFTGSCYRIPGKDYLKFEVFGDELPPSSFFSTRCKACFPPGEDAAETASASSTSSSTSAASSEAL